jgi:hypothetical protein
VAERKHRYIIELALSIMSQTSIPTSFWDELFSTVVYLINRLLCSSNNIPYTTLFKTDLAYSHLRIIGCLCFSYVRPYNQHKLEPRALPCVLLGYSQN